MQTSALSPVCRFCNGSTVGALAAEGTAYDKWALPPGVVMLADYVNRSCGANGELGRDYARLPVTHTAVGSSKGLWFYYARGCSDLTWDVGRTLFTLNRITLLITLVQAVAKATEGRTIGDDVAIGLAAELIRQHEPATARYAENRARTTKNHEYTRYLQVAHGNQSAVELEWLIREGARGVFVADGRLKLRDELGRVGTAPCTGGSARVSSPTYRCRGRCWARAMLLSRVWKLDASLDSISWALLGKLHELARHDAAVLVYDTVQLWQAGFRDYPTYGVPSEIWDVRLAAPPPLPPPPPPPLPRAVHGVVATSTPPPRRLKVRCDDKGCLRPPRHYGHLLEGAACDLGIEHSLAASRCWACNGSSSQSACAVRHAHGQKELDCAVVTRGGLSSPTSLAAAERHEGESSRRAGERRRVHDGRAPAAAGPAAASTAPAAPAAAPMTRVGWTSAFDFDQRQAMVINATSAARVNVTSGTSGVVMSSHLRTATSRMGLRMVRESVRCAEWLSRVMQPRYSIELHANRLALSRLDREHPHHRANWRVVNGTLDARLEAMLRARGAAEGRDRYLFEAYLFKLSSLLATSFARALFLDSGDCQ